MQTKESQIRILIEQLIRSKLEDGIIPSSEEIIEYLNSIENIGDSLSFNNLEFVAEHSNEKSSANKFNNNFAKIKYDLDTLYYTLFGITNDSFLNIERWKQKYDTIFDRIRNIENRVNGNLLATNNTAGYFYFTDETFANASNIDLLNTTARIDFNKKFVGLGNLTSNTKINLNGIKNKDITFNIINSPSIASSVPMSGTELSFIFNDIEQYWGHIIQTNNISPVIIEISSKIFSNPTEISSLDLTLLTSNLSRGAIVQIQYSIDNITWKDLPINNQNQSVENSVSFVFKPILVSYLKIFLTKNIPDISGKFFTYQFGIRNISVGNIGFVTDTDSILVTKPIQILNSNDQPININRISLDVCQEITDKTSINYFITSDINLDESNRVYQAIAPSNTDAPLKNKIINLTSNQILLYNNIKIATDEQRLNIFQPRTICDRVIRANNSNIELPDNFVDNTEIIWRNTGTKNNNILINNIHRGWQFIEPYYITTINVANQNGLIIDFGNAFIDVDGVLYNNVTTLSVGEHIIKIHKRNFYDIFTGYNIQDDWVVNSEDNIKKEITFIDSANQTYNIKDPLYPYNHKLLIEGLQYNNTYTNKRTYAGVSLYAAYKMRKVSINRFINCDNVTNNEYTIDFSLINRKPMFVVKVDSNISSTEFTKELFIVQYMIKTTSSTIQSVILKAILHTDDINEEPRLTAFRLKGV